MMVHDCLQIPGLFSMTEFLWAICISAVAGGGLFAAVAYNMSEQLGEFKTLKLKLEHEKEMRMFEVTR